MVVALHGLFFTIFALNHAKSLQIYFFCVKRQVKNDFLKNVERRVTSVGCAVLITGEIQWHEHLLDYGN